LAFLNEAKTWSKAGVRRTPALDQVFASFKKAKDAATDSSGVNDNVG
jgi:hypothetical protein